MKIDQEGLQIQSRLADEKNNILVIEIGGYVDQGNCHLLQQTINSCMDDDCINVIFDFSKLIYMSSAGWGVLIGEIKGFRENGGDIKLANMGPEIYEIYQMLEFYHIISEYPSVEAALNSFLNIEAPLIPEQRTVEKPDGRKKKRIVSDDVDDVAPKTPENSKPLNEESSPPDDKKSDEAETPDEERIENSKEEVVSEEEINISIEDILADEGIVKQSRAEEDAGYVAFDPTRYNREFDVRQMPIPDKIRAIVAKHPDLGAWKIRKMLRLPEYGEVKIGFFKVRSLLKLLELDTKEKRYRYYRSA